MTSSGSRPYSFDASLWTQSTSLPALARSTGAYHWKPGSPSQTSALSSCVSASLVSRLRRPSSVSSKWLGVREPQPPGCDVVEHDRAEVAQLGVQQRELAPLPARHEDQAARLVLDQPLEQPALLGRQLAVVDAHVAQEHHVELRQLVQPGRELLDVVLVAAAGLAQARDGTAGTTARRPGRARGRCAGSGTPSAGTTRRPGPAASPRGSRSAPSACCCRSSVSSGCLGTSSVSVKSPVAFGFQSSQSLVRPIGGDPDLLGDLVAVGRLERDGRRCTRAAASSRS